MSGHNTLRIVPTVEAPPEKSEASEASPETPVESPQERREKAINRIENVSGNVITANFGNVTPDQNAEQTEDSATQAPEQAAFTNRTAAFANKLATGIEAAGGVKEYAKQMLRRFGNTIAAKVKNVDLIAGDSEAYKNYVAKVKADDLEAARLARINRGEKVDDTPAQPTSTTPESNSPAPTAETEKKAGGSEASSSPTSPESGTGETGGKSGLGGGWNTDNIATGNESWDAPLRKSREKAAAKAQRAQDRRLNRQMNKEQRMLDRRKNWAELKDKIGKKWYGRLGKQVAKFARKATAIAKGAYEGGRAAHATLNQQPSVKAEAPSAPSAESTPQSETDPPEATETPEPNNVVSFAEERARRRPVADTETAPEQSEDDTEPVTDEGESPQTTTRRPAFKSQASLRLRRPSAVSSSAEKAA